MISYMYVKQYYDNVCFINECQGYNFQSQGIKLGVKKPNLFSLCPYSQDKNNHRYP